MKHSCVDWIVLAIWQVTVFITAMKIRFFLGREAVKFGVQYIYKILRLHIQGRTKIRHLFPPKLRYFYTKPLNITSRKTYLDRLRVQWHSANPELSVRKLSVLSGKVEHWYKGHCRQNRTGF
jgi:hypothetical protein